MRIVLCVDELPTIPGVYVICNTENGKVYVGSSTKGIRRRVNSHIKELNRGKHGNTYLQRSWNTDGEHKFAFAVFITCTVEECLVQEQRAIDRLGAAKRATGYNVCPKAGNTRGFCFSDVTRAKLSAMRRGKKQTPEHAARRAASTALKLRGKVQSAETNAKRSATQGGRKQTAELIAARVAGRRRKKIERYRELVTRIGEHL